MLVLLCIVILSVLALGAHACPLFLLRDCGSYGLDRLSEAKQGTPGGGSGQPRLSLWSGTQKQSEEPSRLPLPSGQVPAVRVEAGKSGDF